MYDLLAPPTATERGPAHVLDMPDPMPPVAPPDLPAGWRYARLWVRGAAAVIDAFVIAVLGVAGETVGVLWGGQVAGAFLAVAGAVAVPIAALGWCWERLGATPGMSMCAMRVVDSRTLGVVSRRQAQLRASFVVLAPTVVAVGLVLALLNRTRRAWHDLLSGTVVVEV